MSLGRNDLDREKKTQNGKKTPNNSQQKMKNEIQGRK